MNKNIPKDHNRLHPDRKKGVNQKVLLARVIHFIGSR
jgi:hypothetical protein